MIIADKMLSFLIGVFHVKREGEIGFYLRSNLAEKESLQWVGGV